jgi:hypothetical protein
MFHNESRGRNTSKARPVPWLTGEDPSSHVSGYTGARALGFEHHFLQPRRAANTHQANHQPLAALRHSITLHSTLFLTIPTVTAGALYRDHGPGPRKGPRARRAQVCQLQRSAGWRRLERYQDVEAA